MIDIIDMSFSYGEEEVFHDFNLHIDRGEFVALTGKSGSGKTTLIKLLLRDLTPSSGSVRVLNQDLSHMNGAELVRYRRRIGTIFQDIKLLQGRSVYENLEFAGRILELSKRDATNRLTSILSMLGLSELYAQNVSTLSGGQQQRVCFARSLMGAPNLILCDEPTGNLDPVSSEEFIRLIHMIHMRGITVVMATHDISLVSQFADCRRVDLDQVAEGN